LYLNKDKYNEVFSRTMNCGTVRWGGGYSSLKCRSDSQEWGTGPNCWLLSQIFERVKWWQDNHMHTVLPHCGT